MVKNRFSHRKRCMGRKRFRERKRCMRRKGFLERKMHGTEEIRIKRFAYEESVTRKGRNAWEGRDS
jgi:hypothetical protein